MVSLCLGQTYWDDGSVLVCWAQTSLGDDVPIEKNGLDLWHARMLSVPCAIWTNQCRATASRWSSQGAAGRLWSTSNQSLTNSEETSWVPGWSSKSWNDFWQTREKCFLTSRWSMQISHWLVTRATRRNSRRSWWPPWWRGLPDTSVSSSRWFARRCSLVWRFSTCSRARLGLLACFSFAGTGLAFMNWTCQMNYHTRREHVIRPCWKSGDPIFERSWQHAGTQFFSRWHCQFARWTDSETWQGGWSGCRIRAVWLDFRLAGLKKKSAEDLRTPQSKGNALAKKEFRCARV